MSTEELVARLRAAMDETERVALAATLGPWRVVNVTTYGSATVDGPDAVQDGGADPGNPGERRQVLRPLTVIPQDWDYGPTVALADATHIARHDPAAALARVAADREILNLWEASRERDETMRRATGSAPLAAATGAYKAVVEVLAQAYGMADEDDGHAPA